MPELRRELGLRDLTLFAITCIVGVRWIPAIAHAGPSSITLLAVAALLFVVPLAIAVGTLAVKYPGAGGMYVWARRDFGPWHGFLCFWVFWISVAFWFPSATMFYMSVGLQALGLPDTRIWLLPVSMAAIWIALATNMIGLRVGKWTENAGACAVWIVGIILCIAAAIVWMRRGSATHWQMIPTWSWDTVSFYATVAYSLSGLELVGLMGAEIHQPERTLPRVGWLTSAVVTVFYAACVASMLVLLEPQGISEMTGLAQAGTTAAAVTGAHWLGPEMAVLVLICGIGQFGGIGTAVSRLPFAAGVDNLLPPAFARVHPRWGTPPVPVILLGAVASFLLVAVQIGDTLRAAFQALVSLMVITGFLPYLYIFGCSWKAGNRWSAAAGTGVTIMAILCSVVPTAEVKNVWLFELKLAAGNIVMIATGWILYRRATRNRATFVTSSSTRQR